MELSWILGRSRTRFTHAERAVKLTTKSGSHISFSDFCKNVIPPCDRLNPLLFNGHLQTAWTAIKTPDIPVHYKRKLFQADDIHYAGSFAVDFVVPPTTDADPSLPPRTSYFSEDELKALGSKDSKPMLVVLHGLSGGSHELYLRHVLEPLTNDTAWEACVVNSRGCANSKITTGILYNARATWDTRQVVKFLREVFPNRPLYGVGFSLGANILTNYIGEEGSGCLLNAAVVFSNPWNLEVSSLSLKRTWIGLNVYSKVMGGNMKKMIANHETEIREKTKISMEEVQKVNYLHEFDRVVQCPSWGYPTEDAYYRDASSVDSMLAIRIPFLAINAEDDPISSLEAIPFHEFKQNPYAVLCTTSWGGHLSWFEIGGGRWFARSAIEFFNKAAEEINFVELGDQSVEANGIVKAPAAEGLVFEPMRRRLHTFK